MPEEFSRTTKNKTINGVLVPVITSISFIDPVRQYQEYQFTVDNSGNADRDVHVDNVAGIDVERVDVWKYLDPVQRYQEKQVSFDNRTMGESPPPYFITHAKTHVVRYSNGGNFVDSELIDEFSIIDPVRNYQEYVYALDNPPGSDDGTGHLIVAANPDDPDITDSANGVDPPYRTDPFQNIVNIGSGFTLYRWFWFGCATGVQVLSSQIVCGFTGTQASGVTPGGLAYLAFTHTPSPVPPDPPSFPPGAFNNDTAGSWAGIPTLSVPVSPPSGSTTRMTNSTVTTAGLITINYIFQDTTTLATTGGGTATFDFTGLTFTASTTAAAGTPVTFSSKVFTDDGPSASSPGFNGWLGPAGPFPA